MFDMSRAHSGKVSEDGKVGTFPAVCVTEADDSDGGVQSEKRVSDLVAKRTSRREAYTRLSVHNSSLRAKVRETLCAWPTSIMMTRAHLCPSLQGTVSFLLCHGGGSFIVVTPVSAPRVFSGWFIHPSFILNMYFRPSVHASARIHRMSLLMTRSH